MVSSENDWDLAICGLNCAKCDMYMASHGDDALHSELLKWFKENVDNAIVIKNGEKCKL